MDVGLMFGRALEARVASIPGVSRAQLAGSARRRVEKLLEI